MTNKLKLPVESRMQGDLQVRFGGRSEKTYRRKAARHLVVPSLQVFLNIQRYMIPLTPPNFLHYFNANDT